MVGMLQILTYMLAFYLVIKGVEILQIALSSGRERRGGIVTLGVLTLIACMIAAGAFVHLQDRQAGTVAGVGRPDSGLRDADAAMQAAKETADVAQDALDATTGKSVMAAQDDADAAAAAADAAAAAADAASANGR